MFCYTVAQNFDCVLRELTLWSNISKEHPTFLLTVADLANIPVSEELEEQLVRLHQEFDQIEQTALALQHQLATGVYHQVYTGLVRTIQAFLHYDAQFLQVLERLLLESQPDQTVWQVLVTHIRDEQTYMYRLLSTLLNQIY